MASGDSLCMFMPLTYEPASANNPDVDFNNYHPVLLFDAATNESAVFTGIMPQNYAGTTGVTVYIHYSMASATTLTIDWDIEFERIGDQQQNITSA